MAERFFKPLLFAIQSEKGEMKYYFFPERGILKGIAHSIRREEKNPRFRVEICAPLYLCHIVHHSFLPFDTYISLLLYNLVNLVKQTYWTDGLARNT